MSGIRNIAVVGGGLMGAGIAQVFAAANLRVTVFEPDETARGTLRDRVRGNLELMGSEPAIAERIQVVAAMEDAVGDADYVTEAAPEKLELKQAIFAELERCAPSHAILASNTSVIPITRITGGFESAARMVGTHWWNPPYLVPLVEVIQAEKSSRRAIDQTMALLRAVGKEPAHVHKDVPGFVANRLQHALWREAIAMVAEGICDAATVDSCVKNSFGLRLPVLGPLENADLVGLDLTLDIHEIIIPELDSSSEPSEYLRDLVDKNLLGFKNGAGFRSWTEEEMTELRRDLTMHLVNLNR